MHSFQPGWITVTLFTLELTSSHYHVYNWYRILLLAFDRDKTREHITPVLASLHCLSVKFRVDFKVLVFVFKALHGLAPIYISDLLHFYSPVRTLRSSSQKY